MANFAKKSFIIAVAVATIATFGFGFVTPNVAQAAVDAGTLVKGPNSDAVYYIGSDMKKYVFPDAKTYFTWYSDFSNVQLLSVSELDTYADGGMVLYRAGTKMITHPNTAKVYAVEPSGNLRWIPSEEIAAGLFGADWASRVNDVNEVFFPQYTVGSDLSAGEVPAGSLVKMEGSDTIYLIEDGAKRPFASMDALNANNYDANFIITVSDLSAYSDGSAISGAEGNLGDVSQGGNVGTTPVVTGGLNVSLSSASPASQTLVAEADGLLMMKADFMASDGDVTVTGLKIKRVGLGSYNDFDYVWLVVDGKRRGSVKSLNSTDIATLLFSSDSQKVTIPSGQTKSFEIYAQTATAATSGNLNGFQITEVTTDSTVSGLPVTGSTMSMSGVKGPDVNYDDVSIGTSVEIGDTGVELAKIKLTNQESNETAVVKSLTFKSASTSGTRASTDEVTNFKLYDGDGNLLAGPVNMDSDYYVRFSLNAPFAIPAGTTKYENFTVTGDIAGGPGHYLKLDVEGGYDLGVYGGTNDYHADMTSSTWAAQEITIGNAILSVNVDTDNNPLTRTMDDNTDAVVLLKGNFRADQGAVTVTGMRVTLTGSDMDFGTTDEYENLRVTDEYENLRVYVDGVLTSEATGSTISSSDSQTSINVDFTDTFSVSGIVPFEINIDAKTVGADEWIRAAVPGANMSATRDSDGASISPSGTATGNKVTFGTPTLQITPSSTAPALTRVKGSADVVFAAFDAQVGTTSDVTLKSIKFQYGATGGTADQNDLQNLRLMNSDMTVWAGPDNLDSSEQYNFTGLNKPLAAGATLRFYVVADLNSTFNDSSITAAYLEIIEVTANDASGDSISVTDDGTNTISSTNKVNEDGGTTTITVVDRGVLTVELSSATPDTHMVVGSSTGNTAAEFKLNGSYEDISITTFKVTAVAGSGNDDELAKVYLYQDGSEIASTTSVVSGVATFNFNAGEFVIPAGATSSVQVRADINTTNDTLADTGATVQFSINDINNDIEAQGTSNTIYPYVKEYNGSGVTLTSDATAAIDDGTNISASDTTIAYDTLAVGTMNPGNVIKIDSEYMLITAATSTELTVVRGVANSSAASHNDNAVITEYDMKVKGNTMLVYANYPVVASGTQPAGGLLTPGVKEVLKFTVSPIDGAEEDLRLEEVVVRIDGQGMTAAAGAGWYITNAWLYNGSNIVGSVVAGDIEASGDITFGSLDSDADGIVTTSTVFTVKVEVALGGASGAIDSDDSLQASINDFGSANAAGSITGGDIDWIDMEGSTVIEWVDTDLTQIVGPQYSK